MKTSETIKVIPARYPLRAVGAVLALLVLAVFDLIERRLLRQSPDAL